MNYDLAKQLKDAGFPQNKSEHYYIDQKIYTGIISEYDESFIDDREVDCPTLTELIEACGDGFLNLTRTGEKVWSTNYRDFSSGEYDDFAYSGETYGSTPEEAVALLWLELNKK